MKSILLSLIFAPTLASAAPVYHYVCDYMKVTYDAGADKIRLQFPADKGNQKITIDSEGSYKADPSTEADFANGQGLKDPSFFARFKYPNGNPFMVAEEDTGEEGFTFAVEQGFFTGEAQVQASTLYWSEWHDSSPDLITCIRQ